MKKKIPLLGLETEYGIIREDLENSDPVEESMKLLKVARKKAYSANGIIHKRIRIRICGGSRCALLHRMKRKMLFAQKTENAHTPTWK